MAGLRKIVVKGKTFLWTFGYDDYDCWEPSQIVIKDSDRKGKLIIQFSSHFMDHGYCPFNKGLYAKKNDEDVVINLNRPKYIAAILTYVLEHRLKDDGIDTTEYYNDGIEILNELGYVFNYHLDNSNFKQ